VCGDPPGGGGGGSIFWKTQDTALYSTYIESYIESSLSRTNESFLRPNHGP
jgi:hypothetical protein